MKVFWKRLIALLLVMGAQVSLMPYLSRSPFYFDLLLVYLFYLGFYFDQVEAGILGIIGGFLRDSFSHRFFGLSALVYGLAGFLSGFFRRLLVHYPIVAFSFTVWGGTFSVYFLYYFLLYLFGLQVSLDYLLAFSLGAAFSNFLVAIFVSLAAFFRRGESIFEES